MESTLNACIFFGGNFFSQSFSDPEGFISTFDGTLMEMLGSWTFATTQSTVFPKTEVDAT